MGKRPLHTYCSDEPGRHSFLHEGMFLVGAIISRDQEHHAYFSDRRFAGLFLNKGEAERTLYKTGPRLFEPSAGFATAHRAGASFANYQQRVENVLSAYLADPQLVSAISTTLMVELAKGESASIRLAMQIAGATPQEAELGVTRFAEGYLLATTPAGGRA